MYVSITSMTVLFNVKWPHVFNIVSACPRLPVGTFKATYGVTQVFCDNRRSSCINVSWQCQQVIYNSNLHEIAVRWQCFQISLKSQITK